MPTGGRALPHAPPRRRARRRRRPPGRVAGPRGGRRADRRRAAGPPRPHRRAGPARLRRPRRRLRPAGARARPRCRLASTPCWRWPGWRRPRRRSAWCRPSRRPTPSRSTSPRTSPRSTSSPAAGPAGGWRCRPPPRRRRRFGRNGAPTHRPSCAAEADDAIEVVSRLWDSWEDDAVIRDRAPPAATSTATSCTTSTSRGAFFSVRGPSITPRSPQGQPLVVVDADDDPADGASPPGGPTSCCIDAADAGDGRRPPRRHPRAGSPRPAATPTTSAVLADGPHRRARRCAPSSTGSAPPHRRRPSPASTSSATPAQVADVLEAWFVDGAVDGFLLRPDVLPATLDWFVDEVVRLLRPAAASAPATRGPRCATASGSSARPTATPTAKVPTREPAAAIRKQIHLAAHFPGVNNTTVWSDPTSGSQTDFASFVHLARTAERGKFDFFFLAEGLRLREHRGRIFDLDVVGRPDSLTVLAALAAVTDRIGLAATLNTTFNEPFELARQFATLDHLSRRAGRLERGDVARRVHRRELPARRVPRARRPLPAGRRVRRGRPPAVGHLARRRRRGRRRARRARRPRRRGAVPPPRPAVLDRGSLRRPAQPAGLPGADPGRRLRRRPRAGRRARRRHLQPALRATPTGRRSSPTSRAAWPATAAAGTTSRSSRPPPPSSATPTPRPQELAAHIRLQQVSPQGAIAFVEQVWGRDLSAYDPDGPLPDVDPDVDGSIAITRGRVRHEADSLAVAAQVAGARRAQGPEHPPARHRGDRPLGVRRQPGDGRRDDRPLRAGRRRRRLHPRAPPHAARPRPLRRRGRPAAPGAGRVPRRLRGPDAARPPRPDPAAAAARGSAAGRPASAALRRGSYDRCRPGDRPLELAIIGAGPTASSLLERLARQRPRAARRPIVAGAPDRSPPRRHRPGVAARPRTRCCG